MYFARIFAHTENRLTWFCVLNNIDNTIGVRLHIFLLDILLKLDENTKNTNKSQFLSKNAMIIMYMPIQQNSMPAINYSEEIVQIKL
jgi:hypothetical protein